MKTHKVKKIHGTSICYQEKGLLFLGPSGSGKSDLALRLIQKGGILVADDQTLLSIEKNEILMSCPMVTRGKIEIRGIGIFELPYLSTQKLDFVFNLRSYMQIKRLPEFHFWTHQTIKKPFFEIDPFEKSAEIKIDFILQKDMHYCLSFQK